LLLPNQPDPQLRQLLRIERVTLLWQQEDGTFVLDVLPLLEGDDDR